MSGLFGSSHSLFGGAGATSKDAAANDVQAMEGLDEGFVGNADGCFASCEGLAGRLHSKFCKFQVQARRVQDRVEATHMPVDSSLAEDLLQQYSCSIAAELRAARDELGRGKWDIDPAVRKDYDSLSVCLAAWELVHEMGVSTAPSAARLLHWYTRHFLEEEAAEWWQEATRAAACGKAPAKDAEFWEVLLRLALSDCHNEVHTLLRNISAADPQITRVCEFFRKTRSLLHIEQSCTSRADFQQAVTEVQTMAKRLLANTPEDHPTRTLLRVYTGCGYETFEKNEDIGAELGRTWIEDVAYSHAWSFPEMRATDIGDLLKAVTQRRAEESTDDLDQVWMAALALDVPGLLKHIGSMPDRFPPIFAVHLVDVLYFAGRVPLVVGASASKAGGHKPLAPRELHLAEYAKNIGTPDQGRQRVRLAIDYLRAGGSEEVQQQLENTVEEFCKLSATDAEMEEAAALAANLGLSGAVGARQCRRHSALLRGQGDVAGCLRWACQAEQYESPARGFHVSELLDSLAGNDKELAELFRVLQPASLDEPLSQYPPTSLLALLCPSGDDVPVLAPSGRLYFFVQYARCRALKAAGRPASEWAPCLVGLLAMGVAGPPVVTAGLIEQDLLPALSAEEPALSTEEASSLMRSVHHLQADAFGRSKLTVPAVDMHRALGLAFSRSVLRRPAAAAACGTGAQAGLLSAAGLRGVPA